MIIDDARLTKSCKNMHVSRFVPKKSDNVEMIREADELEESKITTLCGTK